MKLRAAALALCGLLGCSEQPSAEAALVTVNGQPISELEVELQLHAGAHSPNSDSKGAVAEAMTLQELAAQRARKEGLRVSPEAKKEIDRMEALLANARRRALAAAWFSKETAAAATVTPEEARGYVASHQKELGQSFHLAMVMRRSKTDIETVAQSVHDAATFEAFVKNEFSQAQGTPWDLGFLEWSQMPPQWRPVIAGLKAGDVSPIIQGDHERYWLVELIETRPSSAVQADALEAMATQLLIAEKSAGARERLEKQLTTGATIVSAAPKAEAKTDQK